MMSVIEQVCELIDTTDDVFSFKVCDMRPLFVAIFCFFKS